MIVHDPITGRILNVSEEDLKKEIASFNDKLQKAAIEWHIRNNKGFLRDIWLLKWKSIKNRQ